MAKKVKTAEPLEKGFDIDDTEVVEAHPVHFKQTPEFERFRNREPEPEDENPELVNCLRNERVIVKHINRPSSITDPRHVCFGRMHENAQCTLTVPLLTSGVFVNVLTNSEKKYLEHILGLEKNALSVYNKVNNFWDESTGNPLASVTLKKDDNILDLSQPDDFIRYKILLANKNLIAPSYEEYQDHPKATYLFYITSENEQSKKAMESVSKKSQAYIKLGEMSGDLFKMRAVLEMLLGRPTSKNSKEEFLKIELSKCIDANAKEFLKICADEYLDAKVLIKRCHEEQILSKKGDWYYLRSDGSPLCDHDENPTLSVAARFLMKPKNQELLFSLQAKLNK